MSVFSAVLVLQYCNLNIYCCNVVLLSIVQEFCFQRNCVPACWLFEFDCLDLFKVLHVDARSDCNFGRCVWFVAFEIKVQVDLLDSGLFHELDVDQVRLRSVRLPESADIIVSELLNTIALFCRTQSPHSLFTNLSAVLIVRRGIGALRVD
jgi:hypothetical protein